MDYRSGGDGARPACPNFAAIAGFGQAVSGALLDLSREHSALPCGVLVVTFGPDCDCVVLSGEKPPAAVMRRLAETLLKSADLTEGKVCG